MNCDCGNPLARRQVKKEGPTKGKWFLTCAGPMDGPKCEYFQFEGEERKVLAYPKKKPSPRRDASPVRPADTTALNALRTELADFRRETMDILHNLMAAQTGQLNPPRTIAQSQRGYQSPVPPFGGSQYH